jgi:Concanavalin A-like lectin/glucanases superfamily
MAVQYANARLVTDGLVLALDASDRNSYVSGSSTWNDLSGNNYNGSFTNGHTFDSSNNGSIIFNGSTQYLSTTCIIEAATSSNLQTFCSWLYGTSYNSFFGSSASSGGQFHLILTFSSGQLQFGNSYFGGIGGESTVNVAVSANSTWNCGCVVKTAAQTFDVYFNGSKVITGATRLANNSSTFSLGRWWNTQYVPARIASAQVYNRALSATEILQNYNAQKSRFGLT